MLCVDKTKLEEYVIKYCNSVVSCVNNFKKEPIGGIFTVEEWLNSLVRPFEYYVRFTYSRPTEYIASLENNGYIEDTSTGAEIMKYTLEVFNLTDDLITFSDLRVIDDILVHYTNDFEELDALDKEMSECIIRQFVGDIDARLKRAVVTNDLGDNNEYDTIIMILICFHALKNVANELSLYELEYNMLERIHYLQTYLRNRRG